jgi:hypothetical protein
VITLSEREWLNIREQLKLDYADKPSIWLMRSVMRRELGFTTRSHQDWNQGQYHSIVYLDFYDEPMETIFRLKYLNR